MSSHANGSVGFVVPSFEGECITVDELIDGLETIKGKNGWGALVPPPGDGPDEHLTWAVQEILQAYKSSGSSQGRLCTNAVMNARRSLACLTEWYLNRDLVPYCHDAPATAKSQAAYLMNRGIIDELTAHVLERAIGTRNVVEHRYRAPSLEQAEDVVELIRRTTTAIRAHSDPAFGPWILGTIICGYTDYGERVNLRFKHWEDPLVIFLRTAKQPWVGLLIPDRKVRTRAVVRKCLLKGISTEQLTQILSTAERIYGRPSTGSGMTSVAALDDALGFSNL